MVEMLEVLEEAAYQAYITAPLINGQFTDARRKRLEEWSEITNDLIKAKEAHHYCEKA